MPNHVIVLGTSHQYGFRTVQIDSVSRTPDGTNVGDPAGKDHFDNLSPGLFMVTESPMISPGGTRA